MVQDTLENLDDYLAVSQLGITLDEWGVFEGIVTIEDVLEEIVGDIQDESDTAAQAPSIERRDDGAYVVDGGFQSGR